MWIICEADDSHEMSSLIFSEKKKKKKSSAAVVISTLSVKKIQIMGVLIYKIQVLFVTFAQKHILLVLIRIWHSKGLFTTYRLPVPGMT